MLGERDTVRQRMHTFTVRSLVAPTLDDGESTFVHYFRPLFAELKNSFFIVDNWYPDRIHPKKREILAHYRVTSLNVGRRLLPVYQGKRFLPSYGFAIPSSYGSVFAFAAMPDEQALRSCTYDGYDLDNRKMVAQSVAAFLAFEGTWTLATADLRLVEVLRSGLWAGAVLEKTPPSLQP